MELESCTGEVQLADNITLDGREVTLIDTPGFDDTSRSDTEILMMITGFLAATSVGIDVCCLSISRTEHPHRYEGESRLAGIIYVHRISNYRSSGISGRSFQMFRSLCGESTLKNVILVTNMWKEVSQAINVARERELISRFFKPALDKGALMARHHNTVESAHNILRMIIKIQPVVLQIQRELVDERKDIIDTAAGDSINEELKEQIRRHQAELKELREEMRWALETKDGGMMYRLGEAHWDLEEKIENIKKAGADHAAEKEKERLEAEIGETGQEVNQEVDQEVD